MSPKKITGTLKINGEKYDWSAEACEDSDEYAVFLDLGNGKPECIGYADDADGIEEMVRDEIETLAS